MCSLASEMPTPADMVAASNGSLGSNLTTNLGSAFCASRVAAGGSGGGVSGIVSSGVAGCGIAEVVAPSSSTSTSTSSSSPASPCTGGGYGGSRGRSGSEEDARRENSVKGGLARCPSPEKPGGGVVGEGGRLEPPLPFPWSTPFLLPLTPL